MDDIQNECPFDVGRNGYRTAEPAPPRRLPQGRRFVARSAFAAMSRTAPAISLDAFRADQDAFVEGEWGVPQERR